MRCRLRLRHRCRCRRRRRRRRRCRCRHSSCCFAQLHVDVQWPCLLPKQPETALCPAVFPSAAATASESDSTPRSEQSACHDDLSARTEISRQPHVSLTSASVSARLCHAGSLASVFRTRRSDLLSTARLRCTRAPTRWRPRTATTICKVVARSSSPLRWCTPLTLRIPAAWRATSSSSVRIYHPKTLSASRSESVRVTGTASYMLAKLHARFLCRRED